MKRLLKRLIDIIQIKIFFFKAKYSNPRFYISQFICLTANEKALKNYHNKYNGERCFIIGNGPSLNKMNLKLLKDEYTFGVNAIYTNYKNMGFYPTFWAIEDILVAEDRSNEINEYKGSTKFYGAYLNKYLKKDKKTIYINFLHQSNYIDSPKFSTNASHKIYWGGTVSYLCIQLAYYMGFKDVILVGFDHNYKVPDTTIISNHGKVFTSQGPDPNHFHPDYFGAGKRWHDPKVDRMEKGYVQAKQYFERANKRILNATIGGNLEVFDRVDYSSLF